ncbi:MAG: phosphate/phosphite/phosphonate ABC transporter substrate-binding protein, partial [Halothiobacillaceae bacterium]
MEQWGPLAEYLQGQLGRPVRIKTLNIEEIDQELTRRALDFVLTNPAHYIHIAHRLDRAESAHGFQPSGLTLNDSVVLASLILQEQGHPLSVFGGVIFTTTDSTLHSLRDIVGRRVAATLSGAFGGYQIQAYELLKAGLTPPRGPLLLETGMPQDKVVEAVLAGRAEVGFVRTGVLESLAREGKVDL